MFFDVRSFVIASHGEQKYGDKPYIYHIDQVVEIVRPYGDMPILIAYLHDILEDTNVTVTELENQFGKSIARSVVLLTDDNVEPRALRKEKANMRFSNATECFSDALIVKVADRLANLRECKANNMKKLKIYIDEHHIFKAAVFRQGLCDKLWDEMDAEIDSVSLESK